MKPPKHILVIRLSAMGDVAMTIPVLQRFLQQYPEVKITVLTKPFFKTIFQDLPQVEVLEAEVNGKHKGLFGLWRLAKEIRNLEISAVADLHNVLRSKILRFFFFFMQIKSAVIDKGRAEKKVLTRLSPKTIRPIKTTHQRYAEVFEKLGFPVDLPQKIIQTKPSVPKSVKVLLKSDSRKWIGIAPFAAHPTKSYPLDLMEKVIKSLSEKGNYQMLLFGGGKTEEQQLAAWENKFKNVVSLAGKVRFKDELHTIANLDLMLSMDSGNGHLAAMYQVPVITVWGNTHPYAGFAPFGQTKDQQILPDLKKYPLLPTSIYGNKKVEGYENAMRSISPEAIIEKVEDILG
ncbi:glycosyltransferase family 9 protein [Mesonia sp. K7]|uniref:glycosyltransferase family 9 protein n=1 Tax=Mesonia sp. K7 TaxID=2218606 RepID=UPI000DAA7A3E|nr:glycosyltransferase family 9 protein [Mesonia sp. K7]PZD79094.1 ADP-heptose--LPS heptosyltransferase RfaF [Mesonia sp. K7]